jgi:acyl-coenzyme A thioesterase PaaI-like protein
VGVHEGGSTLSGVNRSAGRGRSVYFPEPPLDPAALEAKHRLADALRLLVEACTTVDASVVGAGSLDEVTAVLDAAGERLAALPRIPLNTGGAEAALAERGPFVGVANPLAAPLHLEMDGNTTRAWAVYGHAYEGGVGDLHGGVAMAAFDDVLGCVQMVGPTVGRTGTLTVRFRAAHPIGERIDYVGRLDRVHGRKIYCRGEARAGNKLLAEADAVFIAPRGSGST